MEEAFWGVIGMSIAYFFSLLGMGFAYFSYRRRKGTAPVPAGKRRRAGRKGAA